MPEVGIPFILAQIVSAVEFLFNIIGNAKLKTNKILLYNGICSALSIIEYCLLGAWTGIACCIAVIIRNIVFSRYEKKIPLYILLIFIAAALILNIPTIHNVFDALLTLNIIVYATALWTRNVKAIKVVGLITEIPCIIYNFANQAYVGVLKNIILSAVQIRCIYQLNKKKHNKRTERIRG